MSFLRIFIENRLYGQSRRRFFWDYLYDKSCIYTWKTAQCSQMSIVPMFFNKSVTSIQVLSHNSEVLCGSYSVRNYG